VLDIDRNLLLLREIEARMAFAQLHIGEQRAIVRRLTMLGLETSLAHDLLRSMEDSLVILENRHHDLLRNLHLTPPPPPPRIPLARASAEASLRASPAGRG
jgi:hypothetical protein